MIMEMYFKEITLRTKREEKENIFSVKDVFYSHNLIRTHLRYLRYIWQMVQYMLDSNVTAPDKVLEKLHMWMVAFMMESG